MTRLACALLFLLALLAVGASRLRAEDPAETPNVPGFGGGPPPTLPKGADDFLKPTERTDLLAFVKALRRQVAQLEVPPPSTEDVTALRDAWNAVLKPRVGRMAKRLERWTDPARWLFEEGEDTPYALKPDQWTAFTRDMASLATELHGAWKQYGSVKLKPKESMAGSGYVPSAPRLVPLAYPWPVLYSSVLDRQAAGARLGRWGSSSYWRLLNRFLYAWDWSWVRRAQWDEYWRKRRAATKDLFEQLRSELDGTRDTLGDTLLGVQAFVAALQNAEEERVQQECVPCRTQDETLVAMAEKALSGMHEARLQAEAFQGRSVSAYGTILRRWLRAQKAAVDVLAIAGTEQEPAESDESDDE